MSEEFDAAGQKKRNSGTAEEFRAEMQRMRDELTEKANAFIKILDGHARPAGYTAPLDINDPKPVEAKETPGF